MNQENPYATPSANLSKGSLEDLVLSAPRKVSAAHGVDWIKDAFTLFKGNMGLWIAIVLVWMIATVLLSMIPLVSLVLTVLMPIFYGGILLGARAQDEGGELEFSHLFAGFKHRTGRLAAVGGIYLAGFILMMIVIIALVAGGAFIAGGAPNGDELNPATGLFLLLAMLIGMGMSIPLVMAYWFAPALVVFHDIGAFDAMKLSFRACLRNILPFLLYGLLAMVLLFVGMIPLLLGLLFVGPILVLTFYTSYKDVFSTE